MFTTPWALLALSAVPVVVGIYLFRTRARRREVSSLFLWVDQSQAQQGGRKIEKIQFPLLLLLELLILSLLAVAASGPNIKSELAARPTVIILDDSYSMQAEVPDSTGSVKSVHKRAEEDLLKFIDNDAGFPIQFILAGSTPSLVSSRAKTPAETRAVLKEWTCNSPTAAIDSAISLASRTAISGAKILVVSDHSPQVELSPGKLRWFAYGTPESNIAIVHANRVYQADKDRILVEIANKSPDPSRLQMLVLESKTKRILQRFDQPIAANETIPIRMVLGSGNQNASGDDSVEIQLADDALAIDNRFTLLSPVRRTVRAAIFGVPADIRLALQKAIESSGIAEIVDLTATPVPDIVFCGETDDPMTGRTNEMRTTWIVRVYTESSEPKVQSYVGPFIIDRNSPLTTGLSLDGVVWSASSERELGGLPIIAAGNVPLLTEHIMRSGEREIRMQINERLSTLTLSPVWPILVWNMLKMRSGQLYGVPTNNLRLGSEAEFIARGDDTSIELTDPLGKKRTIQVRSAKTTIPANECGLYQIKASSGDYRFSVGTLSGEESDLSRMEQGRFGSWLDEETIRTDYRPLAWILLLIALGCLTLHLILVSRSYGKAANF